jgi:hypothetical protein
MARVVCDDAAAFEEASLPWQLDLVPVLVGASEVVAVRSSEL